ncbi:hypothetical protein QTP70_031704, partial [Hemibagrus guttatus]
MSQGDMTKDTENSTQLANSQNTEECEGTDMTIDDSGFTPVRSKRKLRVGSGGSKSRKKGLVETEEEKQITTGKETETEPSSDPETNVDKDSDEDQETWWDHGKVLIQQLCREYTVNITRNITKSLKDLEIGIVELQVLAESTGDRRHVEDLKVKKVLMADLLGTKAQDFYQDLYRSEHRDSKELLDIFYQGLPKVSSEDNAALEGSLVLEELQVALNTMPGGKAPGIDGLPVEFYKFFWKERGSDLLEVLEESCRERCLHLSSRRAVITLLPKKGDFQDIKNWRPVSLLCTDYKVMSKALANRLRDIMDSVLHEIQTDQTYCVPNRSIIDNVSLIRDILDVSRSLAVDLGLISLDQEEAIDRVEHQYLWKTLEAFGLSPSLIAMMKVLYQDVESVLKINGGLSTPFKVQGGIRQGCSLSAWTLFKRGSQGPAVSLYWILEKPLVGGGRMDSSPGLALITQSKKFTTLKRLVDTAGPEFKYTRAVAEELSLRSLRNTEVIMQRWNNKLSEDELNLIKEYHDGTETPDRGDPFPELELLPDLNGYEGMY